MKIIIINGFVMVSFSLLKLCRVELLYDSLSLRCTLFCSLYHLSCGASTHTLHPLKLSLAPWAAMTTVRKCHKPETLHCAIVKLTLERRKTESSNSILC